MSRVIFIQPAGGLKPSCPSDTMLAEQFLAGRSEWALQRFFEKYKTNVPALQRRIVGFGASLHDAEDICQDALLLFLKKMEAGEFEVRREGCLFSYFIAIARHLWLNELRRRRKSAFFVEMNRHCEAQSWSLTGETEGDHRQPILESCFRQMDSRSQRLLWGYHVEECNYQDLAKELRMASWRVACQQAYRKRGELRREVSRQISA